jgi:hypothetical protein
MNHYFELIKKSTETGKSVQQLIEEEEEQEEQRAAHE